MTVMIIYSNSKKHLRPV